MNRLSQIASRVASTAFEPGFPEMTDEDWRKLEESHREETLQRQKEIALIRKEQDQEWDDYIRDMRENDRKQKRIRMRELGLASVVDRIAGGVQVADALNGMSRVKAAKTVNNILSPLTKGLFKDEYWNPVTAIWKALTDAGIDWTLEGTKYDHDRDNVPTSKTWKFKVDFANDKGRPVVLYGVVVASGAGSVENPLDRYDLVAYVS